VQWTQHAILESCGGWPRWGQGRGNHPFELLTEHKYVIAGPPDYVVEQIAKAQDIYGMTELLCWTRLGGLDNDKVLRSMELMQDRVFPHVRELSPPPREFANDDQ